MSPADGPCSVRAELGALLRLAVPVSAAFLLNKSISFVGVLFVSHLGPAPLAAASLATSLANVTGYSVMAGLAGATSTLCGQAYGAKNYAAVGAWLQRSIIILSLCCLPIVALWAFTERLLLLVGQEAQVAAMTGAFIMWLVPSLVFYASICSLGNYLNCQGIVRAPFYVAAVAAALHPGVNYLLIDVLGMGYLGAAQAVSVSNGVQLCGLWFCMLVGKAQRQTWVPWSRGCLQNWGQFLVLAIPSMLMMFEWIASEVAVMLAGLLPDPERSLSAMAVYQNSNALAFMVPLGLAIAVITRVSNDLGAGRPASARRAAWVAAAMSVCVMLVLAVPAVLFRREWGSAFTDDPELLRLIAVSTLTLGPYIIFDGLQTVLAGVMRGSGRQAAAVPVIITAYYVLGLPLGAYLAFRRDLGVLGLCLGMLVGTAFHALTFLAVVGAFNWESEADKAMRRVAPKLGEAAAGAVAVRASSCEGEPSDAAQSLLWEHRSPQWRHTSDGGDDASVATAALEGAAAVNGVGRQPGVNGI